MELLFRSVIKRECLFVFSLWYASWWKIAFFVVCLLWMFFCMLSSKLWNISCSDKYYTYYVPYYPYRLRTRNHFWLDIQEQTKVMAFSASTVFDYLSKNNIQRYLFYLCGFKRLNGKHIRMKGNRIYMKDEIDLSKKANCVGLPTLSTSSCLLFPVLTYFEEGWI